MLGELGLLVVLVVPLALVAVAGALWARRAWRTARGILSTAAPGASRDVVGYRPADDIELATATLHEAGEVPQVWRGEVVTRVGGGWLVGDVACASRRQAREAMLQVEDRRAPPPARLTVHRGGR